MGSQCSFSDKKERSVVPGASSRNLSRRETEVSHTCKRRKKKKNRETRRGLKFARKTCKQFAKRLAEKKKKKKGTPGNRRSRKNDKSGRKTNPFEKSSMIADVYASSSAVHLPFRSGLSLLSLLLPLSLEFLPISWPMLNEETPCANGDGDGDGDEEEAAEMCVA